MSAWVDQEPSVSADAPSLMLSTNRLEEEENAHTQQGLTTVFFARCPPATSEAQILELFSQFGRVEEVNVYRRWQSAKTSKGCGFVRFSEPKAAAAALEALNGKHMFESSEVPMVVEWIDPARLANRQRLHSGKMGNNDSKNRQTLHDAASVALSAPSSLVRQPQQLPHGFRSASGHLSDNSSMSCVQLSSFNSSTNSYVDDPAAWIPHQQAAGGCPPVHVVPMMVQAQSSAQMVSGLGVQSAGDWVVHTAGPGLPAQPLGTIMHSTNSPSLSTTYSSNQPGVMPHVMANPAPSHPNMAVNGGGMLQAVPVNACLTNGGNMLLCGNLSAPVVVVNEVGRGGDGHHLAPPGINAAAVAPAGAVMTTSPMLDAAHSNAVVLTAPGQPMYGQQLHQSQVFPAMQACQAAGSGVLQPVSNAHSSTGNSGSGAILPCFSYNNSPMGAVHLQPMMPAPAAGISAVNSSSIIKLNIPPSAAPAIVNKLELLSELSGVAVALVATGNQGLQLHLTGNLAELNTAYQLLGLLNLTHQQPGH